MGYVPRVGILRDAWDYTRFWCPGADPGFVKGGGGPWLAPGARAYNWGLGTEPSEVQGRAPWGIRVAKPPEAERCSAIFIQKKGQKFSI